MDHMIYENMQNSLDYRPKNWAMWDAWYFSAADAVHVYYLQKPLPGDTQIDPRYCDIGHAVTEDLVNWRECEVALKPNPVVDSLDDMQPWTGCVVSHENKYYMYYTMRSSRDDGSIQYIGLATSNDMYNWKRYKSNPVIVPDSRWYHNPDNPYLSHSRRIVDCRDLIIVRDESSEQWLGYYVARIPSHEPACGAVIAAVRSKDLINWEHISPVLKSDKFAVLEVPDVFEMNGKWYMTCLASHSYGNRGCFHNDVESGTIYAVADNPAGPFILNENDYELISGNETCGYSSRSFVFKGKRYGMFTQRTLPAGYDTLSPAYELTTDTSGRLRYVYSSLNSNSRRTPVISPEIRLLPVNHKNWMFISGDWQKHESVYTGKSATGYQLADLGSYGENFEVEANFEIESGVAAGFAIRPDANETSSDGDWIFALDTAEQAVFGATVPCFGNMLKRKVGVPYKQKIKVLLSFRNPRVDFYVNGCLVLQMAIDTSLSNVSLGLFVDRGHVVISNLSVSNL